jgi:hypothetical protein
MRGRRNEVLAIYEVDQSSLDLAVKQLKPVLRGIDNMALRRQRISSLLLG